MDQAEISKAIEQYEEGLKASINIEGKILHFFLANKMCLWRVETLMTKEPATLAWLNTLTSDAVLLDAGANVGMYTVYAAVVRGATVYSFEPEALSYAVLCRNIMANDLSGRVTAWCAALSDEHKFDKLYLSIFSAARSSHTFGERIGVNLAPKQFNFSQGSCSTTLDYLVGSGAIAEPSHVKIDVDGLEHKIINGAEKILRGKTLKSLLVEINTHVPEHRTIFDTLGSFGFRFDKQQFAQAQRTEGAFQGIGECVFFR